MAEKRPRILFVINDLKTGGAENQTLLQISGLIKIGYKVMLVTLWDRGEMRTSLHRKCGYCSLEMDKKNPAGAFLRLRAIYREFRPDIVVSRLYYAGIITKLSLFTEKKIIYIVIQGSRDAWRNAVSDIPDIFLNLSVDGFVANSLSSAHLLRRLGVEKKKIHMIGNGFDENVLKYKKRERFNLIGFVGRYSHAKGLDRFIDYISTYGEKEYKIYLAGRPEAIDYTQSEKVCWNLTDRERIFEDIDILIISSRWEGFPNVAAEAILCGCVVVACSSLSLEHIFGEHIYYYSSLSGLHSIIEKIRNTPHTQRKRSIEARRFLVRNYRIGKIVSEYDRFYKMMLEK
ncbi:MAG: glycosyltransferase family 4 protein [Candidatus Muiribacteriaceae bacterium]